jgi:hypothetical protein
MANIWSVIKSRPELLEKLEHFLHEAQKARSSAWSRECPGHICAFGSSGSGYSMEVALRIAIEGEADDELDATVRISEETWNQLAAGAAKSEYDIEDGAVEQFAHVALDRGARQAIRMGSAGMRKYFEAARLRARAEPKDGGLLLLIGHSMWSTLAAIAAATNEEAGIRDTDSSGWDAEDVARVLLDDAVRDELAEALSRSVSPARPKSGRRRRAAA